MMQVATFTGLLGVVFEKIKSSQLLRREPQIQQNRTLFLGCLESSERDQRLVTGTPLKACFQRSSRVEFQKLMVHGPRISSVPRKKFKAVLRCFQGQTGVNPSLACEFVIFCLLGKQTLFSLRSLYIIFILKVMGM
jgi:hypothetical protein